VTSTDMGTGITGNAKITRKGLKLSGSNPVQIATYRLELYIICVQNKHLKYRRNFTEFNSQRCIVEETNVELM
jgi:hypothetical protein